MQFFSPKGDRAADDYNIAATNQALIDVDIKNQEGQIDFDVLKAVGSYAREIYGTSEPDYFALQGHLRTLFPDRFLT